ncbi:MAG TPA: aldehyde ferredoxin oxidoreductase C-terminal domain-containing protein [Rhodospirillales bacterium]|jgi:aldehyde:ferredoxin oxidoreductase|nr:aldehyde ferredoxin oxidoreductase C-terminal domain-containing protein [Rhodospirillales bacterium]
MRKYLNINLSDHSVKSEKLEGEAIIKAGRNFIVRTLLDAGAATVDPMSPENPLIFSAGPFAGTNFSNANRISVGCKSPMTGGIKESNGGGTFAFALGQLEIAGLTLAGASDDWTVIRITTAGDITFEDATPYLGKGNFEAARLLHEKYGDKVSLALCGPIGERLGLIAGIAFSDVENRPVRLSARGGVGAVMGSKKVKAIVCDKAKMPTFSDRKKLMSAVKDYSAQIRDDAAAQAMGRNGTMQVSDLTNHLGGLPVNNFTSGQQADTANEVHKMGGDYIRDLNNERGGNHTHACMPGCMIKCSNVYVDDKGEEMVSPLEYETICLLGTNVGIREPDDMARLNNTLNDLGVDTIEVGATLGVLMEAGEAEFGDLPFMQAALQDIANGTERGNFLAQGTARVGEHLGVARIPVIKKQALSAYDPRVIEVTGISMMVSAQGADHTTGNLPGAECAGKTTEELSEMSLEVQINSAAADSLGLCVFGRSVTNASHPMIIEALNAAFETDLGPDFINEIGRETLLLEIEFNEQAGFTEADDVIPQFFYEEELPPTGKKARHFAAEVNKYQRHALQQG